MLEDIIGQTLAPLPDDVGVDLAANSPAELTPIRDQFSQSNRNFRELFDLGHTILASRSKDLWALWALTGGMLWSQQFEPTPALAASCRICSELCKRYWKKLHPQSIGLRNTLLANITKWWSGYLMQFGDRIDQQVLRQCARELQSLSGFLVTQVGADEADARRKFPMLTNLAHVSEAMIAVASRPATRVTEPQLETVRSQPQSQPQQSDDWWESDSLAEFELPEDDALQTIASPPPPAPQADPIGQAYAQALHGIQTGQAAASLQRFEKLVEQSDSFAARFRGQMMLGELYLRAGDAKTARRVLEYLHRQLAHIQLIDWEPELCRRLWNTLLQSLHGTGTAADTDPLHAEVSLQLHRLGRGQQ